MQIAQHDGPIKSIHWIKAPNYSCIMTGSWDKTLKHDGPIKSIHWIKAPNYSCIMTGSWDKTLKVYPMAVVTTVDHGIIIYNLENQPSEFLRIDSPHGMCSASL
ncbi:mRNA export factor [Liparis tanakae]|uniref:mRNA export factor n=1 Tax=Liparis tanakae TaxID=230148 RepID=A0A4Z2EEL8_9TELE|nr:mRNA export factor [Liparis tanakae]